MSYYKIINGPLKDTIFEYNNNKEIYFNCLRHKFTITCDINNNSLIEKINEKNSKFVYNNSKEIYKQLVLTYIKNKKLYNTGHVSAKILKGTYKGSILNIHLNYRLENINIDNFDSESYINMLSYIHDIYLCKYDIIKENNYSKYIYFKSNNTNVIKLIINNGLEIIEDKIEENSIVNNLKNKLDINITDDLGNELQINDTIIFKIKNTSNEKIDIGIVNSFKKISNKTYIININSVNNPLNKDIKISHHSSFIIIKDNIKTKVKNLIFKNLLKS